MRAAERLAAALGMDPADVAAWPPEVAQRYADGEALERLRAALPDGWTVYVTGCVGDVHLRVWAKNVPEMSIHADTIAAAADKAREAVRS